MPPLFPLATVLALTTATAQACPHYDAAVAAVQAGDAAMARPLHAAITLSPECDDALAAWVGGFLARESFALALGSDDTAVSRAALNDPLSFETHWGSLAALGGLALIHISLPTITA